MASAKWQQRWECNGQFTTVSFLQSAPLGLLVVAKGSPTLPTPDTSSRVGEALILPLRHSPPTRQATMRATRNLAVIIMMVLEIVDIMRRLITHPGYTQCGTTAVMLALFYLGAREVLVQEGVPSVKEDVEMRPPTRRNGFTLRTPSAPSGQQGGTVQFPLDPPVPSPLSPPL